MMDYRVLTAYTTALANVMAESLSDDETAVFAAFFTQLGDTLATILTVREVGNIIPTKK